jgi:preprotein translocase subunit SecB
MTKRRKISSLPTPEPYESFLRSVQLVAMGLDRSSSELDRPEYARLSREQDGGLVKFNANYRLDSIGTKYFEVTGIFTLVVEDSKTKKAALRIETEYSAHLHANSPIDKKLADQFTHSDLRIILWPFFRQYVFDETGRMAIPPITVPISTSSGE